MVRYWGMKYRRDPSFVITALIGTLLVSPAAYADIYKYVDKHGRVTLTDTPTNTNHTRLVKTWKGWVEPKSTRKKGYSINFAKNMKKFSPAVDYVAQHYKLPRSLLHAVITAESAYDPAAVSRAGAVGLMQLMPETAKRYGVKNRLNPIENIHGGSRYLRDLLLMFDNNLILALAAYNAGENAVKEYGNKIPPYRETQNYVRKVLAYYKQYKKTIG
ncbi:MAG: transglycosylase protein [Gammaproteobacteria bacterium]|nr:transglycosylase protein [Gammaproteobacteria bacterium]